MKIAIIFPACLFYSALASAQFRPGNPKPEFKKIRQDTINITGIVYDATGAVAPRLTLYSKNRDFIYSGYYVGTDTDKEGKFVLKGALFHDTLTLSPFRDNPYQFIVNGSRYVEIHLPETFTKINLLPTVALTAKRKYAKKIPVFKVVTNELILDYYGIVAYSQPYLFDGKERYITFIKQHFNYPPQAIEHNVEGEVEIAFTIEKDGSLSNYKTLKGIGYGCEEAVIDVLRQAPKWAPALTPNGTHKMQSSISIQFKLTD
ncbi:energy transducer TonB [Mucilaginibacter galii]|uniref:TonB C-terminal domain-containing protein n=1 Tax=Mucilaginibacter galii TaxID=2005073 RepID=A0A917JAI5_9SPHI|nr:energy transducer TonB [Mucilaginibacter galii]GGI50144.1 hypothetical protein GCM10011425_13560 [Mucilaginibacter galii]